MIGETIKSFLVGLGFGVDDASLAKFNKAILSATVKVTALYASVKLMAAATVVGLSKVSESFEQLGYEYRIIAPAINKALLLRRELLKAYAAAGINITKVVQASVRLNFSLAKTRFAFQALYQSVASKFFERLTKSSDLFRQKIYANMPKIQAALERMINFIFKALDATTILGSRLWSLLERVYDFFVKLDSATDGWSTRILAAAAAWKLLNLGFLATPLGLVITGLTALLALWDDFKTFKEGGESLINWGSETTRIMVGLATAIGGVVIAVYAITAAMRAYAVVQGVVDALLLLNPFGLILIGIVAVTGAIISLIAIWKGYGTQIKDFFSGLGSGVMNFLGSAPNAGANAQTAAGPMNQPIPGGANQQNNSSSVTLNQQTAINVTGVADANAAGNKVSSEQGKTNFDLVRNLRGATR